MSSQLFKGDEIRYIRLSFRRTVVGVIIGAGGGWTLGRLLALGYHGRGPSDPGDAPVYVEIGLLMVGACVVAIGGLVLGIILFCAIGPAQDAIPRTS
jgi:hypothetical protein